MSGGEAFVYGLGALLFFGLVLILTSVLFSSTPPPTEATNIGFGVVLSGIASVVFFLFAAEAVDD